MNTKEKKLNYEAPFTEVQPMLGSLLLDGIATVTTGHDKEKIPVVEGDPVDDGDGKGAKELNDVWQPWSQGNGCYNWDE